MDLHDLENTPPWEWPADARNLLLLTLREESASERDRGLAAELAGDLVVMNDELAAALLAIVENPQQPPDIRAKASIALGPALEHLSVRRRVEEIRATDGRQGRRILAVVVAGRDAHRVHEQPQRGSRP